MKKKKFLENKQIGFLDNTDYLDWFDVDFYVRICTELADNPFHNIRMFTQREVARDIK